jgi:hypothetical protein
VSATSGAGNILIGEREVDVLGYGEVVEQVIALEDHADVAPREVRALLASQGMDG